jgi:hypothetical protein
MASKPHKEEVKRLILPHQDAINALFLGAWDRWWKNPDRATSFHRTRACIVHNYLMNDAVPVMRARKGVHVVEKHETAFFIVAQRLLFRLKKGDDKGLSSNVGTQASLAFSDPDKPLSLFTDLPYVWRVDIAYVLNYLQTKIDQIVVVARDEKRILWSFQIYGSAAEGEAPPPPTVLPVSPHIPPPADSGLRIPGVDSDKKKKRDSE